MLKKILCLSLFTISLVGFCNPGYAITNILVNPGFEGPPIGDGWGAYGAADFNDFFSGNAHGSLYGDNVANAGGIYQLGIAGTPGLTYQFDLLDTLIEASWDADLFVGLEYYAADDATKLGETVQLVNAAERITNGNNSGSVFSVAGKAVAGTAYVRPIVRFENVNPAYSGQTQANLFIFDSYMSIVPAPGQEMLRNPGFDDLDTNGTPGDYWGAYGNTSFNEYWPGNPHATLWADTIGNSGGLYQQGLLGQPGTSYQFTLKNVRVEDNFDGELFFGLEYYAADDFTKVGETIVPVDTAKTGDGLAYTVVGQAAPGTVYVRPVIRFENVLTDGEQHNVFVFEASLVEPAPGYDMLENSGFLDLDTNGEFGDGWGFFGNTDFNDYWVGNPHASFYGDWLDSEGGVYQLGIAGVPEVTYQFDLLNTRIEENWDADFYYGLEYYGADDEVKIGETLVLADTATRVAQARVDGNVFSMQGTAPAGTKYVRPVIRFDNVNQDYLEEPQSSAFVFKTYLGLAPWPNSQYLKNGGFGDADGDGYFGDYWSSYGAAGFHEFFGNNNSHASLFADNGTNFGGVYQQAILGTPGEDYRFDLLDVRIEENFDADLFYGLEYYGDDDGTKIGETIVLADTSTTGDGLSFTVTGTAPAGTVYVRPVVGFDNVGTVAAGQTNVFVFATSLTEVSLTVPGDSDGDGDVDLADYANFADCLAGPENTPAGVGCVEVFDFDVDGDVDLADFAAFQAAFTG